MDANVLFPLTLRDTFLLAAAAGLYQLRWSDKVLDEVESNLAGTLTMPAASARMLRLKMEAHFPEAMVIGYQRNMARLRNDPKDRHVVAAALKSGAQFIVTFNLRDFRPLPRDISAVSPDAFLCGLHEDSPTRIRTILEQQARLYTRPRLSSETVLERLGRVVPRFVRQIRDRE